MFFDIFVIFYFLSEEGCVSKKRKKKKQQSEKSNQIDVCDNDNIFLCCSAQLTFAQKEEFLSDANFSTSFNLDSVKIECVGRGDNFLIKVYANTKDAEMIVELLKLGWMSQRWRKRCVFHANPSKRGDD